MPPKFEAPVFDALLAEQEAVQASKFQGRLLAEYSSYIFPGQSWRQPRSSAVTDFLRPLNLDGAISLDGVLQGMYTTNGSKPVSWVDMGGGRGLPMRQLAADHKARQWLTMTNVDLFNLGFDGLEQDEIDYLESLASGITDEATAPRFIQANVETVTLPEPADIITSVEAIQYLNDPLAAISNWYNQLADDGVLIISTEHNWASWVGYRKVVGQDDGDEIPTKHLLDALNKAGVAHAASKECDWRRGERPDLDPGYFRNFVIQKKPGTQMAINSDVTEVCVNPYGFKAAFYEKPKPGARPLVEIIAA